MVAANGWFAVRPSGTEDVYKIYAESFRSADHLHQIQVQAQDVVARVTAAGMKEAAPHDVIEVKTSKA